MEKKEKKEFAWDKEVVVKTVTVSDYEKREVRVCELKGKQYVAFTTIKKIKEEWRPVGGYTVPMAIWLESVQAVHDFKFASAFGTDAITIPAPASEEKPAKKPAAKKTTKKGADK